MPLADTIKNKNIREDKVKAAIFDVDNTITTRDTFLLFFLFILKQNPFRIFRAYRLPVSLLKTRFFGANRILVKQDVFRLLQGMPEDKVEELCFAFIKQVVTKHISARAVKAMEHHQKEGYQIILLSASPENYLVPLCKFLGADYCIGTRIEIKNGKPLVLGTHCYGEEKVKRLNQFIVEKKLSFDYKESFFYSDHHSDIPLFENVGHPIAVNATSKLKSQAIKKGWPSFQWK